MRSQPRRCILCDPYAHVVSFIERYYRFQVLPARSLVIEVDNDTVRASTPTTRSITGNTG
jgi:hypothetical protein